MVFQNKAGLWLLVGIPILILIYVIRSHHEDYPVSSTYIWRLSSKFRKKRLPMQKFRRFLLFVTQLLIIVAVAGILSRPSLSNGDSINYIVILDASGSMNTKDSEGLTRFDRALEQISQLADYVNEGHTISLITASDTAAIVLEDCDSTAELKRTLKTLNCTNGVLSLSDAVTMAEKLAESSGNAAVIFYTDSDYETESAVEVINLNTLEWNVYVSRVTYTPIRTAVTKTNSNGGVSTTYRTTGTEFTGIIYSENQDATFTVGLKIDGKITDVKEVSCAAGSRTEVVFSENGIKEFDTAEVYIIANDGLSQDNSYSVCMEQEINASVLLKTDSPLYLESALSVLGNCTVTVIGTDEDTPTGYDLYIFDGYTPLSVPTDGSVLFINCTGLNIVNLKNETDNIANMSKADTAELSKKLRDLTLDMSFGDIYVSRYIPIVLSYGWNGILYCNEDCIFAVRQMDTGLTQMVLSFDLHSSNLPMLSEFVYLMRNIVKASIPSIIYETELELGESISFAVLPSMDEFYIQDPDGDILSLIISDSTITYTPGKTGIYTAIEKSGSGGAYADFFVHLSEKESVTGEPGVLSINLSKTTIDESGNEITAAKENTKPALTPLWYWFALAALILLLIEWEVYSYEQY